MKHIILAAAAAVLMLASPVSAADIEVSGQFMRATPMVGGNGAAFLTIRNHGGDDRLVAAEAAISKSVELHTHVKDGEVFRMRKVDAIAVPKSGTVELKPGGDHVMFMGLVEPMKEGVKVPVTLVFERAGKIMVEVPVLAAGAMGAAPMMQHGPGMKH
ncbi:copper chaperone PCu(A)C [Magnetospirillum sp. SS-4]|uniref:copper chaperone PCu(A)C n=1 Tax=Magnetospirillum sp. SS-4 TaxID=2681465 RepID=UPI00137C629D|nr:copper chaperone PCu(A)C [Magnetospirillum sp. SS-4]CAA7615532.1 conserved exported hypothetical protein [Magnetospirillum sp. SS-4]